MPPLIMNNTAINAVAVHKHLGLTINSELSWSEHIDSIVSKASKRLSILRKLKFTLDRSSLEKMYLSFIRPILEYADIVWDNLPFT